jgi:SAM-dependent methyltransferase
MPRFYPTGYHENRDDENHRKRYELQFSYINKFCGKRILDIGCARGDWLNYIKEKWVDSDLHGVDAFSNGVKGGKINFHKCQLPDAELPIDYFDLITSWAVFEHLHTPARYFEVVSRVLCDGGKFVFLVTNSESCYGKHAYREDVPRHLYHFSKETLRLYAEKFGLKLEKVFFDDRFWDGRGWGTFRFKLGRLVGVKWQNIRLAKFNFIQRIVLKFGSLLDRLIFSTHWESRLGRSGIMIAIIGK